MLLFVAHKLKEAANKVIFLMDSPLRGGGSKELRGAKGLSGLSTKKKCFLRLPLWSKEMN